MLNGCVQLERFWEHICMCNVCLSKSCQGVVGSVLVQFCGTPYLRYIMNLNVNVTEFLH